jgi:hypothetical protein
MPFHLPNIFSIHPVKGSLMPEFSANSNLRDCHAIPGHQPIRSCVIGDKRTTRSCCALSSHIPLLALSITYLYLIYFFNLICGKLYELLLIMIHVIYTNNIFSNGGQPKQNRFKSCCYLISSCDCLSLLGGGSL